MPPAPTLEPREPRPMQREPRPKQREGPPAEPANSTPTPPQPERPPHAKAYEPALAPWDAELDALTEQLVAELRRDLGPEAS